MSEGDESSESHSKYGDVMLKMVNVVQEDNKTISTDNKKLSREQQRDK